MSEISPLAAVHPEAKIAEDVTIGPFCQVGPHVEIGKGCRFNSHVVLDGHLKIGEGNVFFPFTSIGTAPQDMSYKGQPTRVDIGDHNIFREYVSIHRGTTKQDEVTKIGSHGLFMAYVHFGHDVVVEDHVIIANACNIAGHVRIGNRVIIGGGTNISQFISLGEAAYIGGGSGIDRDIPSFCTAYGNRIKLKGINIIGLKRLGHSKSEISEAVDFYRTMEASALSPRAFIDHPEFMEEYRENPIVRKVSDFILRSEIGIPPFMS